MFKENTKGFKVLTPDGYKPFKGVQKLTKQGCIVRFDNGRELKCCIDHPLCVDVFNFEFRKAKHLDIGEKIFHKDDGWVEIKEFEAVGEIDVYDLIEVEDTISYYTNGFLSHNCEFVSTGDSSIDEELFEKLMQNIQPPKIELDEGCYKIWEETDESRLYVAGVDTSEGVGADASVIQIFDITDLRDIRQVAVYYNNKIPPLEFSNKVNSILKNWGSPLALIERNNCGAQVVDRLANDLGYEKIVSYGNEKAHRKNLMKGMIAHTNTKYKGVLNMRYFINEAQSVIIRDELTLRELKSFVRYPNGTWRAQSGKHDDRVMSLLYALFILEKDITERFFEIVEFDAAGKPLFIEPMDFGIQYFEKPTSIYLDNEVVGYNSTLPPVVFGMGDNQMQSDMDELEMNGFTFLQ